jgi:hypothetical protein
LKACWASSLAVIDAGLYNLPVGSGMAELVAVKYRGRRRLHAGDTWELYVGKDGRAEYFVYHRGGAKKPSLLLATWGGQKRQFLFFFNRSPRQRRRQADTGVLHGRGGQGDGIRQVDDGTISRAVRSYLWLLSEL